LEQKGGKKVGKVVHVCVEDMGEVGRTCGYTLVYFGTRQRKGMANLTPQFLYVWAEHAQCPLNRILGGPQGWSGFCFGDDRNFLPHQRSNHMTSDTAACGVG